MLAPIFLLAALLPPASAACPADAAMVRADVAGALSAWKDWRWDAFEQELAAVQEELGCLSEVLPKTDTEQVHLLHALAAGRAKDGEHATAAFKGVLALQPEYVPDEDVAQPGSLMRSAFDVAQTSKADASEGLSPGSWFLDGTPGATAAPTERNGLLQLLDQGGTFRSWYLQGEGLPEELRPLLATAAHPVPAPLDLPPAPEPSADHGSRGLLVSGLVAGVAAGGALIGAAALEGRFHDAANEGDATRYASLNHGVAIGGFTLGAGAAGLLVGAVVKGQW